MKTMMLHKRFAVVLCTIALLAVVSPAHAQGSSAGQTDPLAFGIVAMGVAALFLVGITVLNQRSDDNK